jgi:thiamine-phosphate pyrophosphorylase
MIRVEGYYFITDDKLSLNGSEHDVLCACKAGVGFIQYRNKTSNTREFFESALRLKRLCSKAKFIINDRLDIALAVDADGLHIGQQDLPIKLCRKIFGKKKIIGVSVSSLEEAKEAIISSVDYLGVGPVFATATKKDAFAEIGLDLIKKIKKKFDIPIVAIGGITLENALDVIAAGADAICAISAVVTKPDFAAQIHKFQRVF